MVLLVSEACNVDFYYYLLPVMHNKKNMIYENVLKLSYLFLQMNSSNSLVSSNTTRNDERRRKNRT